MAITIDGSGITSANIADGTIVNADINSSAAIDGTKVSGSFGKVLQVVSTTKTDTWSTTAATLTNIPGLSLSIQPTSTSSKILCIVNLSISANRYAWHAGLFQAGSEVGVADAASNRQGHFLSGMNDLTVQATHGKIAVMARQLLLYPNTTSVVDYDVRACRRYDNESGSATTYINRSVPDRDNTTFDGRATSTITLMEIGA